MRDAAAAGTCLFGTVDSWLLWVRTGGFALWEAWATVGGREAWATVGGREAWATVGEREASGKQCIRLLAARVVSRGGLGAQWVASLGAHGKAVGGLTLRAAWTASNLSSRFTPSALRVAWARTACVEVACSGPAFLGANCVNRGLPASFGAHCTPAPWVGSLSGYTLRARLWNTQRTCTLGVFSGYIQPVTV